MTPENGTGPPGLEAFTKPESSRAGSDCNLRDQHGLPRLQVAELEPSYAEQWDGEEDVILVMRLKLLFECMRRRLGEDCFSRHSCSAAPCKGGDRNQSEELADRTKLWLHTTMSTDIFRYSGLNPGAG